MLCDVIGNMGRYKGLSAQLGSLKGLLCHEATAMDSFDCNTRWCTLFVVEEGSCLFATGWRESAAPDAIAALKVEAGGFVLFLPGEKFLVRPSGRVRAYDLE